MRKYSFWVLHKEVISMQLSQQRVVSLWVLDFVPEREKRFGIVVKIIDFGVRAVSYEVLSVSEFFNNLEHVISHLGFLFCKSGYAKSYLIELLLELNKVSMVKDLVQYLEHIRYLLSGSISSWHFYY